MFLDVFAFSGGSIGNLLSQWEQLGVFSYVLPFLLLFSLIFGILTRTNIFKENKGINATIALAVALMALQFNAVPIFFSDIFPKLGIGLSVILVGLILIGLFTDSNMPWIMFGVGAIVFLVIMGTSFEFGTSTFWFWFQQYLPTIIIVAIVLMVVFGAMGKFPPEFKAKNDSPFARALKGE